MRLVPNVADVTHAPLAGPDGTDWDIATRQALGSGVVSGCAVTAQGSPDNTAAVAVGVVQIDGALILVAAGNVTVGNGDGTNPRIDLVVVDGVGAKSVIAGTAAVEPALPTLPAGRAVLAAVYRPVGATTVTTAHLLSKAVGTSKHRTGMQQRWGRELRRWFADLGNAHSQEVGILVMGDSVAAGSAVDAPVAPYTGSFGPGRWIEVMLRDLQQKRGTGRGSPYLPARSRLLTGADFLGQNWTHSGTGLAVSHLSGLGRHQLDIGSSTANYIETVQECDRFKIFYPFGLVGGMGDFQVKVDGDVIATVDIPQTGGTSGNVYDSGDIGPGRHTIRIQTSTTGAVIIEGGIFYNGDYGSGVHVYDASKGGVGAAWFTADTTWGQSVATVAPSLVIYNMGLNDLTLGTAVATFKADVIATLDQIRTSTAFDPSELILIPWAHAYDPGAGPMTESAWLPYRLAMLEVAEERRAAVVDCYELFGYGADDIGNVFASDDIHLSERGHRALGHYLADQLSGGVSGDRGPPRLTLPATADVRTPPAGFLELFPYEWGGRLIPTHRGPNGQPTPLGIPFNKTFVVNQPAANAATGTGVLAYAGTGAIGTVTGTATVAAPTVFNPRWAVYVSAGTNNSDAGAGDVDVMFFRGASDAVPGAGFFFFAAVSLTSLNAERVFVGLTDGANGAATVAAADPGGNHVGFSYITGTANWQVSTRDGTTNSKQDTGLAVTASDVWELALWVPAGSATVYWTARLANLTKVRSGEKTTNLPGTSAFMRRVWQLRTTEAVTKTLRVARLYCETDR